MKRGCEAFLLVATSFDSKQVLLKKYGNLALKNLHDLENEEYVVVLHEVDGTDLERTLQVEGFDKVVFQFPHSGSQRVHQNRALLSGFFLSVKLLLNAGAHVDVTLKNGPPYSNWEIERAAEEAGFAKVRELPFFFSDFPGYTHRTTEKGADRSNPEGRSSTHRFMRVA